MSAHVLWKKPCRLSEPEGHLLAFLPAASFQRESRQTSGANGMPRAMRGILLGLGVAALVGSGEAAIANAVTPFERAADTPRGHLHSPYADFASVANEGHKIYLSHDCNGCHGG